jgi:hypothetical protein
MTAAPLLQLQGRAHHLGDPLRGVEGPLSCGMRSQCGVLRR